MINNISGTVNQVMSVSIGRTFGWYKDSQTYYNSDSDYTIHEGSFNRVDRQWDDRGVLRVKEYYFDEYLRFKRVFDESGRLRLLERYGIAGLKEGIQTSFEYGH